METLDTPAGFCGSLDIGILSGGSLVQQTGSLETGFIFQDGRFACPGNHDRDFIPYWEILEEAG